MTASNGNPSNVTLSDEIKRLGRHAGEVTVKISNGLLRLLSEQLYQSPLKAIEELVVNAYDAGAGNCRVAVPAFTGADPSVIVFDDGVGMDEKELEDLWHVGRSTKRDGDGKRFDRKLIGKFGIGKLATYAIAEMVTYVSKSHSKVRSVTFDYRSLSESKADEVEPVTLQITEIDDLDTLIRDQSFRSAYSRVQATAKTLRDGPSWTFAVLEELKPKARALAAGRLRWVLSTAMPLKSDFRLFLDGTEITSSKANYEALVEFSISDLPPHRLQTLSEETGETWTSRDGALFSDTFPAGVSGSAMVTKESLHKGKSVDVMRSNGFFIRVHDRLINVEDDLFGLHPLSHEIYNRFRADLRADDLDHEVIAPREGIADSQRKNDFTNLIGQIFNEARTRFGKIETKFENENDRSREHEKEYVNTRLVERPLADVLTALQTQGRSAQAVSSWFYLDIPPKANIPALTKRLYETTRVKYRYEYVQNGRTERLASFDPETSTFKINEQHDLVLGYFEDPRARSLLEDIVTAEALLEIYLRDAKMPAPEVVAVLERRDQLLRSLAKDHLFSLEGLSQFLRDSIANQYDLEVALISAMRALGFVARHLSGAGKADGVATFHDYEASETTLSLEAKSSETEPSLSNLDVAGLASHRDALKADGCLLIAPRYPGSSRGATSEIAVRAIANRVSCWTIEQLADVVASAEARHITAQAVTKIVLNYFAPDDVSNAIKEHLFTQSYATKDLYCAILDAFETLSERLKDSPRTVDMVAAEVAGSPGFANVTKREIELAADALAKASKGMIVLSKGVFSLAGHHAEIERRLAALTGRSSAPRRAGKFRAE
jgi:hypothetical protein